MNAQNIILSIEPSELLYILNLLGAPRVAGVEASKLSLDNPAQREAMIGEGRQALEENGWLVADPDGGYNLDSVLMLAVTCAADPEVVLITTHYVYDQAQNSTNMVQKDIPQSKQILTHYAVEDAVVEQFYGEDKRYHLTSLAEKNLTGERIADELEPLPLPQNFKTISVSSDINQVEAFNPLDEDKYRDDLLNLFDAIGISNEEQSQLLEIFAEGTLRSEIEIACKLGEIVIKSKPLALINTTNASWIVHDENEQTLFEPVDSTSLAHIINNTIEEFQQTRHEHASAYFS